MESEDLASAFLTALSSLVRMEPVGSPEEARLLVAASFCGPLREQLPGVLVSSHVSLEGVLHVELTAPTGTLPESMLGSMTAPDETRIVMVLLLPERLRRFVKS